jgi:hypothetical protein
MGLLHRRRQGLLEVVSGPGGVILAAEGVEWDQERMGMEDLEEGAVQEAVEALVKDLFRLENGEEVRDYLRDQEEDVVMVEAGLAGVEADIKEFKGNDTISK